MRLMQPATAASRLAGSAAAAAPCHDIPANKIRHAQRPLRGHFQYRQTKPCPSTPPCKPQLNMAQWFSNIGHAADLRGQAFPPFDIMPVGRASQVQQLMRAGDWVGNDIGVFNAMIAFAATVFKTPAF